MASPNQSVLQPPYLHCATCFVRLVPDDGVLSSGVYSGTCQNCGHPIKFWSVPGPVTEVTFAVNGTQYSVQNPDPHTSLNEWLRSQPGHQGTKVMCREAGCGCCVVAVKKTDSITKKDTTYAVNSCLFPLFAANGVSVMTTEGIGNQYDGFHQIQERLAEKNGSQCGYCSPGMVMSMYSLLQNNSTPSKQEVEDNFDGNICRCTGYRPILDAMKSFSKDVDPLDIEELKRCNRQCSTGGCPTKCVVLPGVQQLDTQWYSPTSLQDLYTLMAKHAKDKVRLVGGNTGRGIYKEEGPFNVFIEIRKVTELHKVESGANGNLVIGGGVSLNQLTSLLEDKSSQMAYLQVLADHVKKVANVPVRNVATIAGNLMLTHNHPDFPSDIFTILETVGAELIVGDSITGKASQFTLMNFLSLDMTSKVVVAILLPMFSSDIVVRTYKVMPRAQNAHAYVNAGFVALLDKISMKVKNLRIVYGGIGPYGMHASETEKFMIGKILTVPDTLQGALAVLGKELVPDSPPISSSADYRKSLGLTLFYKFYLAALGDKASARVQSAAQTMIRPVSSGSQSYDTNPKEYPLTQPMTKLAAKLQTSGEAQYINDIPVQAGELCAAFVISTQGNCSIDSLDASEALKLPGVVKFLTAQDIPKGGVNNFMVAPLFEVEEIFVTSDVLYAGQAVGLIVADTQRHADEAAKAVRVTYKAVQPPILTIPQAIAAQSYFPPQADTLLVGDPDKAIESADKVITGQISIGTQHHIHMETQITLCIPEEDGITVHSAAQWLDLTQAVVAQVLGIPIKSVNAVLKRCGGAYGGKATRSLQIAAACAMAAYVLKRPVRLMMNFNTNLEMVGKREPYYAAYKVGVSNPGLLKGVDMTMYADCGCSANDLDLAFAFTWADNVYYCANWRIIPKACKTNTASNTWCRAPASVEAIFIMESIMEHVSRELDKAPEEIRQMNLYKKGQVTPTGDVLTYCNISSLWNDLLASSDFTNRANSADAFNKANRWRKRGLSVVPMKFGLDWTGLSFTSLVSIYHTDGTVAITHGGVEVGQGIHTKVAQVAAFSLRIPLELISIKPTSTLTSPNGGATSGSVTSELCCKAIIECCKKLNDRIDPIRKQMKSPTWKEVIQKCYDKGVDLSAKYMYLGANKGPSPYNAYGVTCTEVELDVLTGERQITRADILYDCGESMNPELDVGQAEGAFVFGLGLFMSEKVIYDSKTGRLLTNGTWEYKPPCSKDIPVDFRVTLLKNAPNPLGILRSKAVGEPPLCMACSSLFAVKHAVENAREETGKDKGYFPLDAPATVEDTQITCLLDPSQFTM